VSRKTITNREVEKGVAIEGKSSFIFIKN